MCGRAMQVKLVTEELRRRGHICEILKINEGRQVKSSEYVDVQSGADYVRKIWRYAWRGFRLNVHVNGMSKKGYLLAIIAAVAGGMVSRPALVTFHGGLSQLYFPRRDNGFYQWAFYALFHTAGAIACDSQPIKDEIVRYGIRPEKIENIATFSPQYVQFDPAKLPDEVEEFLSAHSRVVLSYVSFRPEYGLESLREGIASYRARYPDTGFVWLGFPDKEVPAAEKFVEAWSKEERASLLVLGNLTHDQFLTLLSRSFIFLRTPACDGVAASVLESIALHIPVVASENGRRPEGVVTYRDTDAADMCEKLVAVTARYDEVKAGLALGAIDDNVGAMADWLTGPQGQDSHAEVVAVR